MSNAELDALLEQLKIQNMKGKAGRKQGLMPPGGNMREIRIATARILTIKQKRGG